MQNEPYKSLTESDLAFIRVLEDVIALLAEKNVIDIADLPRAARDKLASRHTLRFELRGPLALNLDDDQDSAKSFSVLPKISFDFLTSSLSKLTFPYVHRETISETKSLFLMSAFAPIIA
jgi:hypothetical protein